jgi:hypothetical protein
VQRPSYPRNRSRCWRHPGAGRIANGVLTFVLTEHGIELRATTDCAPASAAYAGR